MAAVTTWKTTAADNNSAPPDGWPEGQAAASVNNCARQMMADIVREFQVNAVRVLASVAGTNTITGSMTPDLTSYSGGMMVIFTPANNSTGAATLNIDGLGARALVKGDRTALESGDLQASSTHFAIYDSVNSEFVVLNPLSFNLVNGTLSGTLTVTGNVTFNGTLSTNNDNAAEPGFKGIPQNPQAGNYTLDINDTALHIYHASGAGAGDTYTIPSNASVPYPIGTVITFVNSDSNSISIAITSDTMTLAGTTTTGTRTLAQNGIASAIKVTTTAWLISGTALS
jgi:hypothetical protein